MTCLNIKFIIIVILFVGVDALPEEITMSVYSKPNSTNDDYVALHIGDALKITCIANEPMRGMRMEHIDFDSYDPIFNQLNITWKDNLQWNEDSFTNSFVYKNEQEYYNLTLNIMYVTLEHSGWQICYINESAYSYLYVYVASRSSIEKDSYMYIKTKPNSTVTIPCLSSVPNFRFHFLYSVNYSISLQYLKPVPSNQVFKFNERVGYQVAVSTSTQFLCCRLDVFKCIFTYVIIEKNEDKNNLKPIFNEGYSAITSLGTNLKLECSFINPKNLSLSFHWKTPNLIKEMNKTHINDFKINVMTNTTIHISSLTVKNVTMNDLGVYKCSIIDFNQKEIGFARRQIYKKANIFRERNSIKYLNGTTISIKENENCTLLCKAFYPITWNYDLSDEKIPPKNIFIYSSFDNKTLVYQSTLNINLATYENNGFYYCHEMHTWNEMDNSVNRKKIFIYVLKDATKVNLSPNEIITETYIQKHSINNVTISCVPITTNTKCDVLTDMRQEEFDTVQIYNPFHYNFKYDTRISKDLVFECSCNIKNGGLYYRYTKNIILIKVYEELNMPYINLKSDENVTIGEELKLNCTILRYCKQCNSNNRLNVNWSFNDNSTNITQRISIIEKYIPLHNAELYLSTLTIKNIQKTDSFVYECSVGNLFSRRYIMVTGDEKIIDNYVVVLLIVTIFGFMVVVAVLRSLYKN